NLFGWLWIIGTFSAVYFFMQAFFYQDSWIPFLVAFIIGVVGKQLLKDFEAGKKS
ncbi:MAG: hypothetical protein HN552_03475, partial [Porticoccaceae bacterium]|nr:hypothetical protein [Porticoccaceae bacterium]